jgi:Uma2 family endonuclease
MATVSKPVTGEDLLAMPDDGVERWIIRGELRERPMPTRNRFHSQVMAVVTAELVNWCRQQPEGNRGKVFTGDAGVRLQRDPETTFGIDVLYVDAELLAQQHDDTTLIEGVPTLVVEILSPSDTQEDIHEKLDALLGAGVPHVWYIDPRRKTVTAYQPDNEPALFNIFQELSAEPHLPGFRVRVARLFE